MPDKITLKNLSYDQTLPPFLARLRGQQTDGSQGPDPILAARRRPNRVRTASEEAEDAPVVVDEDGNVVQLEAGQLGEDGEERSSLPGEPENSTKETEIIPDKEKEKVAGIGAAKKRKIGRVVGREEEEDRGRNGVDAAIAKAVKATRNLAGEPNKLKADKPKPSATEASEKGGKKKAKKIKLSFGDDDDG